MVETLTKEKPPQFSQSSNAQRTTVSIARGDGIGPEIMKATLSVLESAQAQLDYEEVELGEQVYRRGVSSGISEQAWDVLRQNQVLLKAPITTPRGGGYKSLNVTIRKTFGLFANVRPCISYAPYVETKFPDLDVVVVRENEEDTYGGIEHRQTQEVTQCLKLISKPGSERVIRYAFEYAKQNHRKKVSCFVKDNIMKITDGLFHQTFSEIAQEYPQIENDVHIIDIGSARLATSPEDFDVIVTLNLYGDIISDIVAQMTGSVGLAGSANIGDHLAMFEAIHGSAPDLAGQNAANPSGLLLASVMMLLHVNQSQAAERIYNAWLKTIEDGCHTQDLYNEGYTKQTLNTTEFAQAVIDRLGEYPKHLTPKSFDKHGENLEGLWQPHAQAPQKKQLVGVDVFVDWDEAGRDPDVLGQRLERLALPDWQLKMITNRGVKVYPGGYPETFCTDHWRCRFLPANQKEASHQGIIELLTKVRDQGFDFIKTENLYTFDGQPGYSLGQGE